MTKERWARARAVGVHDARAGQFLEEYDKEDIFKSPFRYGRSLIDERWAAVLSRLPTRSKHSTSVVGPAIMRNSLRKEASTSGRSSHRTRCERAAMLIPGERLSDASVLDLPFEDGRFSFAYQIEVLRYLDAEDNDKAHREILRVIKPGGWYFGTYVN